MEWKCKTAQNALKSMRALSHILVNYIESLITVNKNIFVVAPWECCCNIEGFIFFYRFQRRKEEILQFYEEEM